VALGKSTQDLVPGYYEGKCFSRFGGQFLAGEQLERGEAGLAPWGSGRRQRLSFSVLGFPLHALRTTVWLCPRLAPDSGRGIFHQSKSPGCSPLRSVPRIRRGVRQRFSMDAVALPASSCHEVQMGSMLPDTAKPSIERCWCGWWPPFGKLSPLTRRDMPSHHEITRLGLPSRSVTMRASWPVASVKPVATTSPRQPSGRSTHNPCMLERDIPIPVPCSAASSVRRRSCPAMASAHPRKQKNGPSRSALLYVHWPEVVATGAGMADEKD
jgi:hypothetical protein